MTLTDFLLARIAEDEAWAAQIGQADGYYPDPYDPGTPAHHTSLLAECEAKRRIVEFLEDERQRKDIYNRDFTRGLLTTDGDLRSRDSANARWAGLDAAVRLLALPYADHPDFRPEWRT